MIKQTATTAILVLGLCITAGYVAKAHESAPDTNKEPLPIEEVTDEILDPSIATAPEDNLETISVDLDTLLSYSGVPIIGYKDSISKTTVIVTVDDTVATKEAVTALCEKYDLEILYDYNSFAMYALKTIDTLSDEDFDSMIDSLGKEPGILSVVKDSTVSLDQSMGF